MTISPHNGKIECTVTNILLQIYFQNTLGGLRIPKRELLLIAKTKTITFSLLTNLKKSTYYSFNFLFFLLLFSCYY